MHSNVTSKNVSWLRFSWTTLYMLLFIHYFLKLFVCHFAVSKAALLSISHFIL